jgi:hypothetical protein
LHIRETSNATEGPLIVLPFGLFSSHRICAAKGQNKLNGPAATLVPVLTAGRTARAALKLAAAMRAAAKPRPEACAPMLSAPLTGR